jgi:hypothetical protein
VIKALDDAARQLFLTTADVGEFINIGVPVD